MSDALCADCFNPLMTERGSKVTRANDFVLSSHVTHFITHYFMNSSTKSFHKHLL